MSYWKKLAKVIEEDQIIIDRPKGSSHHRFPDIIYPLDYGYIENTSSMDGGGIDILVGSANLKRLNGIICTIDMMKRDSEIKVLYSCTEQEIKTAADFFNSHYMSALLIRNHN